MDPEARSPEEDEPPGAVVRRIRGMGLGAYLLFAFYTLPASGFRAFVGLTCSAAVTMISFLWLEGLVNDLLQPAPHSKRSWRLTLRASARFLLLGLAILVTIYVARFHAFSVLLGFSIIVVGIIGEAVYSGYRSLVS